MNRKRFCLAALMAAAAVAIQAATVTDLGDSGAGTLRQAIADATSGDTINFALSGTITLTSGELVVDKNLTIDGIGQSVTISGNDSSRVLLAQGSGVLNIAVRNLTVTSGLHEPTNSTANGGAIYNEENLTIENVNVTDSTVRILDVATNNKQSQGGGIFSQSNALTITGCVVSGNTATGTNDTATATGTGGGIFVYSGTASISGSVISDNTSTAQTNTISDGGGITVSGNVSAFTMSDCVVSGNSADEDGGGILIYRVTTGVSISDTTITGNSAQRGGGIDYEGSTDGILTLDGCTISDNLASRVGIVKGAGIMVYTVNDKNPVLNIINSTIAGNQCESTGGGEAEGGAIYVTQLMGNGGVADTRVNIRNSTITGNDASSTTAANGRCGGIFCARGLLNLNSSIVAGNTMSSTIGSPLTYGPDIHRASPAIVNDTGVVYVAVTNGGSGYTSAPAAGFSGGGGSGASASTAITDGVVTRAMLGNSGSGYTSAPAVNFSGGDGSGAEATAAIATATATYNLIGGAGGGHNIVNGVNGNIVGSAPDLAALADNGGPTDTMMPNPTSPALRKIPRGSEPYYNDSPEADQRGYWIDRPDTNADYLNRTIGAVWDRASATPARGFRGWLSTVNR